MAIYNREDPRTALPQLEKQLQSEIDKVQEDVDSLKEDVDSLKADYVIEQGEIGDWTYRKWNSGFVECFGVVSTSSLTWTAYLFSQGYYANWAIAYPFTIYDAVVTSNTRGVGSNVGWVANANPYSDNGFTATIVRNGNTGTVTAGVHVVGRWK